MKVIGFGDQILDVVLKTRNNEVFEYAVDGGGSVWNSLVRFRRIHGFEAFCIGSSGADAAGRTARERLERCCVEIIGTDVHEHTMIIHQFIDTGSAGDGSVITTYRCPFCFKERLGSDLILPGSFPASFGEGDDVLLCFDSLRHDTLHLKTQALERGWRVAADLGYPMYTKNMACGDIAAWLRGLYYLQLSGGLLCLYQRRQQNLLP